MKKALVVGLLLISFNVFCSKKVEIIKDICYWLDSENKIEEVNYTGHLYDLHIILKEIPGKTVFRIKEFHRYNKSGKKLPVDQKVIEFGDFIVSRTISPHYFNI